MLGKATVQRWLTTVMLWAHVASAAWWVLACVIMALAGAVLGMDSAEGREFIEGRAPVQSGQSVAAAVVLMTGIVNIYGAGEARRFRFSPAFVRVLAIKIVLYGMMFAALRAAVSWTAESAHRGGGARASGGAEGSRRWPRRSP